jgi:hypothetical protein
MMVSRTPQAQKTPSPTILYNSQAIPSVDSFKFLGLHVTNTLCMTAAAKHMKPAVYHAWRKNWQEAVKKGVAHMPHVILKLIQTCVLPSAMNNCQVWGASVLGKNVLLSNDLQRAMLSLFRRLLGVRQAVSSNCILDDVCAKPLQQYWLGACLNSGME